MLAKFDSRSDIGIFLGYFLTSRAYRLFNKRTNTVMESTNVVNESSLKIEQPLVVDDFIQIESTDNPSTTLVEMDRSADSLKALRRRLKQVQKDHSNSDIIGDLKDTIVTRNQTTLVVNFTCYVLRIQQKKCQGSSWMMIG